MHVQHVKMTLQPKCTNAFVWTIRLDLLMLQQILKSLQPLLG